MGVQRLLLELEIGSKGVVNGDLLRFALFQQLALHLFVRLYWWVELYVYSVDSVLNFWIDYARCFTFCCVSYWGWWSNLFSILFFLILNLWLQD